MAANDLSFLQHEPCIMKHGPKYENPWRYVATAYKCQRPGTKKVTPVFVYSVDTKQTVKMDSMVACRNEYGFHPSTIHSAVAKHESIRGKFFVAFSLKDLRDNIDRDSHAINQTCKTCTVTDTITGITTEYPSVNAMSKEMGISRMVVNDANGKRLIHGRYLCVKGD